MSNIVERLRGVRKRIESGYKPTFTDQTEYMTEEAADEIERLRENSRLLCEALRGVACGNPWCKTSIEDYCTCEIRAVLDRCEVKP